MTATRHQRITETVNINVFIGCLKNREAWLPLASGRKRNNYIIIVLALQCRANTWSPSTTYNYRKYVKSRPRWFIWRMWCLNMLFCPWPWFNEHLLSGRKPTDLANNRPLDISIGLWLKSPKKIINCITEYCVVLSMENEYRAERKKLTGHVSNFWALK